MADFLIETLAGGSPAPQLSLPTAIVLRTSIGPALLRAAARQASAG